ncbi:hypothetical protein KIN20_038273 [Parelaphostrongylus tenuis]|uniref:Uncharacterized protein n=1 Tax=Parelaphostrongylus tenuis TaxID=148309 RepID=A0AAD5REX3_PARTN|nr:hypothetical protein KIN20_038273 [Parelaphostrongylus tenuis]
MGQTSEYTRSAYLRGQLFCVSVFGNLFCGRRRHEALQQQQQQQQALQLQQAALVAAAAGGNPVLPSTGLGPCGGFTTVPHERRFGPTTCWRRSSGTTNCATTSTIVCTKG